MLVLYLTINYGAKTIITLFLYFSIVFLNEKYININEKYSEFLVASNCKYINNT